MNLLLDLHIHTTRYSTGCSLLEPHRMIERLLELGLDGAAITEHNYCWSQTELERLKEDCGADGLFLVSGMEVDSDIGHLLIFGCRRDINPMYSASEIVHQVHDSGGAVIWAHPLRYGRFDRVSDSELLKLARTCDALEALTPSHTAFENERAMALAETYGLTATGSSDSHSASSLGACLTQCRRNLESMDDLVAAIRDGAVRPLRGGEILDY